MESDGQQPSVRHIGHGLAWFEVKDSAKPTAALEGSAASLDWASLLYGSARTKMGKEFSTRDSS